MQDDHLRSNVQKQEFEIFNLKYLLADMEKTTGKANEFS
jgi:hypothetical protein